MFILISFMTITTLIIGAVDYIAPDKLGELADRIF